MTLEGFSLHVTYPIRNLSDTHRLRIANSRVILAKPPSAIGTWLRVDRLLCVTLSLSVLRRRCWDYTAIINLCCLFKPFPVSVYMFSFLPLCLLREISFQTHHPNSSFVPAARLPYRVASVNEIWSCDSDSVRSFL